MVPVNISAKMVKVSHGAAKPLLRMISSSPVAAASPAPAVRVRPRPASTSTSPASTRLSVIATTTPGESSWWDRKPGTKTPPRPTAAAANTSACRPLRRCTPARNSAVIIR